MTNDIQSTNSSAFTLYTTDLPFPVIRKNISEQFYNGNAALSSVFLLAPGSALSSNNPTLRAPYGWSFSIGLQGDMFVQQATCSMVHYSLVELLCQHGLPSTLLCLPSAELPLSTIKLLLQLTQRSDFSHLISRVTRPPPSRHCGS